LGGSKLGDLTGTQAYYQNETPIILASGYDLRLNGNSEFHWGATNFISSTDIDATTWHHIAVTLQQHL
jgi:hypothetical protein